MVAGGSPIERPDHAEAIAEMALDMLVAIQELNVKLDSNFDIRIGINSGRVLAGVIGGFSRSTDNLRTDAPTNEWCVRSEIRSDD